MTSPSYPKPLGGEVYLHYANVKMSGGWIEITWGLRQLVTGICPFAPFTYRGLVEFLTMTKDILESLGDDQAICQETAPAYL